jgi:hypothetical protein
MKFHDDKSDLYPLKGLLKCPEHDKSLTAYACRSHTRKLHHYYLCCKDRCKHRYRIQDVHESIEDILSTISFSAQIVSFYKKTLEKIFEKDDYQRKDEIQKTKKELEKLELRKSNLQNDLMDRTITPQDYQDMKGRVDKDIVLVKDKLIELQQEISPFKIYIQKEVPKRNKRSILTSCAVLYPERTKVATILSSLSLKFYYLILNSVINHSNYRL